MTQKLIFFIAMTFYTMAGHAVLKGTPIEQDSQAWRSVVMFEYFVIQKCIGTFISDTEILTAGHCLEADPSQSPENNRIWTQLGNENPHAKISFFRGNERLDDRAFYVEVDKVIFLSGYVRENRDADIAILKLKKSPFPTKDYKPLKRVQPFMMDDHKSTFVVGLNQNLRELTLSFATMGNVKLSPSETFLSAKTAKGLICAGDSGAPLLKEYDGELYIMGVLSGPKEGTSKFYDSPMLLSFDGSKPKLQCSKSAEFTPFSKYNESEFESLK